MLITKRELIESKRIKIVNEIDKTLKKKTKPKGKTNKK